MKIVTRSEITNADNDLVLIVFKDDAERKAVIKHLQSMKDKPGERGYAMYPEEKFKPEWVRSFAETFINQG